MDGEILDQSLGELRSADDMAEPHSSRLSQLDRIVERQHEDIVYLALRKRRLWDVPFDC